MSEVSFMSTDAINGSDLFPHLVALFISLITVPISAIILRIAIGMFNKTVTPEVQVVRMPSLWQAIGIAFAATIGALIVAEIILYIPGGILLLRPEEIQKSFIPLVVLPSVIIVFFVHSAVISLLLDVNYGTGLAITVFDYVVRIIVVTVAGSIGFAAWIMDGVSEGVVNTTHLLILLGVLAGWLIGALVLRVSVKLFNSIASGNSQGEVLVAVPGIFKSLFLVYLGVLANAVFWILLGGRIVNKQVSLEGAALGDLRGLTIVSLVISFFVFTELLIVLLPASLKHALGVLGCLFLVEFIIAACFLSLAYLLGVSVDSFELLKSIRF